MISASVDGAGKKVFFDALLANQRPGLLLSNGVVYIAWAAHGDAPGSHGWLIGYDALTLQQAAVFNTTPNTDLGGIWMAGAGPAADSTGAIYLSTGNGTFDVTSSPTRDYGDSVLKFSTMDECVNSGIPGPSGKRPKRSRCLCASVAGPHDGLARRSTARRYT